MQSNSKSGHQFAQAPQATIERSSFNRNHGYKTTFDSGYLIPVLVDEILPADTFNVHMTTFARLATPIKPIMDNMFLDVFYFFVPNRLLWTNWQKFNGEQTNPGDSTSFIVPQMVAPAGGYANQTLQDYMGLPTLKAGFTHNALFTRAYNLIYNEWFRDENLQNSVVVDKGDGPDTPSNYVILRRGKRHDYFTSCLPWPQKGPAVPLPLGSSAPVRGIGVQPTTTIPNGSITVKENGVASQTYPNYFPNTNIVLWASNATASAQPQPYADLTSATAATINQLRQSFQIQKLYERDARGGTRYIEILKAHFGVTSPDSRLQRPELLATGSTTINFNPIAQTAPTVSAQTPQGNLAGFATSKSHSSFTQSFVEHGILIGLVSVRADLTYQQGLNRMWSRVNRFDYYWPALAHIGEQAVLNQEIYCQGSAAPTVDAAVFGYQERYAEYRYFPSQITGKFRSNDPTPLDYWHLAQNFASLPVLASTFIQENPPVARIIAVPSEPQFLFDAYIEMKCARAMPMYSVPGLIDHF